MADVNILIADNDNDALMIYTEYLRSAGYNVLAATSVDAARALLDTKRIDLAILDLRLTDDSEYDRSGLQLAQEVARTTPKIILTKWPTYRDAREALKLDTENLPPAVDFLNKADGLGALGDAVRQALLKYVRINRDLVIQHNEAHPVSFLSLIGLITPMLSIDMQQQGSEELEDLFRRLFYDKSEIKVDRLLWQRDGRVALVVFAFVESNAPESLVVVCGPKEKMEEEGHRYREFAPAAPGHSTTVLNQRAGTQHFTAHGYALAGADLGDSMSLEDLYRSARDRTVTAAFATLFDETLAEWHQQKRVPVEGKTLGQLYGALLGLPAPDKLAERLDGSIHAIARRLPSLGCEIHRAGGRLKVTFGAQTFSYADPSVHLDGIYAGEKAVVLMKTPGELTGANILADRSGRTWLTDFAAAGLAPALWNYVSLETVVRFDWVENTRLQWLHDMELLLVDTEFSKLYATGAEAPLRKTVRTVQSIRRLASRSVARQPEAYHLGVLFHAVRRLNYARPSVQLTSNELTRLGHVLLAAAMILDRFVFNQKTPAIKKPNLAAGIHIDHVNRLVSINGVKVQIRGQGYELLHELYLHANERCPRAAIVKRLFGETYEETNMSQISRLNTAVRRLREKIEEDPNHPRFLLTEPGLGYKLALNGKMDH
jgi:DNA-binding response OmpR family regulator